MTTSNGEAVTVHANWFGYAVPHLHDNSLVSQNESDSIPALTSVPKPPAAFSGQEVPQRMEKAISALGH
jgi:hypothetical protein